MVEVFPIAIGHYSSPDLEDLDVETQVGRLVDLLAPFGGVHRAWAHPPRDRGANAVQKRLSSWASLSTDVDNDALADRGAAESPDGAPESSVLYWVGHGWSNGHLSALAHAHSPVAVGAAGVAPQQLAYALRARRALLDAVSKAVMKTAGRWWWWTPAVPLKSWTRSPRSWCTRARRGTCCCWQ